MEKEQTIRKCPQCGYSKSGKSRSNNQNRYYWSVVVGILSEETGYDANEIHEMIKRKFLTEHRIVKGKKGQVLQLDVDGSTTDLDTKQFEELMSKIRIWASRDLSIYIPEPNEETNEETNQSWFN